MSTISPQHPAVVLRSTYTNLRTLLVIAMVAVVGLSAAVVILAGQNDTGTTNPLSKLTPTERRAVVAFGSLSPAQINAALETAGSIRYDGGPEEGTRGAEAGALPQKPADGRRYDGGPEEGTRGPRSSAPTPEDALRLRSEALNRINGLD
jgi:hypothetical protein